MSDMTVANTIAEHVGGRAIYMMGAKNLVGSEDSLTMRLGRGAEGSATHLRITLTPEDLYHVETMRCRGTKVTPLRETIMPIYADMLRGTIADFTGFALSL